jgi:hypothetical protein
MSVMLGIPSIDFKASRRKNRANAKRFPKVCQN